jgi:hypothetical protein
MESDALHGPLDHSRREIRLIDIISTTPDIVCELSTVSLDDEPVFTALSYVWGEPEFTESIIVNGKRLLVTPSLAGALRDIYYHWSEGPDSEDIGQTRKLWADGLCINQKDTQEKNHQIPLMGAIYSKAERVLSWLGPLTKELAIDFYLCELAAVEISDLAENQEGSVEWMAKYMGGNTERTLDNGEDIPESSSEGVFPEETYSLPWDRLFKGISSSPYWSRVWIFQELVLAREIQLISGIHILNLSLLFGVVDWVTAFKKRYNFSQKPPRFTDSAWGHLQLPHKLLIIGSEVRMGKELYQLCAVDDSEYRTSLFRLINLLAISHEATNPKDYIYGYLGVTKFDITPDYSEEKTVASVYCDFIEEWFRQSPFDDPKQRKDLCPLWFLGSSGVGNSSSHKIPDLPSWAPNYADMSDRDWHLNSQILIESKVQGLASTHFSDCKEKPRLSGSSLLCSAILLGELSKISLMFPDIGWAQALYSWIYEYTKRWPTYQPSRSHTLSAILQLLHRNPLSSLHMEQLEVLLAGIAAYTMRSTEDVHSDLRLKDLDRWDNRFEAATESEKHQKKLDAVYDHGVALDSARMRRFAETSDGYLGVFPTQIAQGDILCLLNGCDLPVVLRKSGNQYLFVGTCFVADLLDESGSLIGGGQHTIERIEIV